MAEPILDENRFDLLADASLRRIESTLSELDPDDCEVSLSMGVMTLEFADRSRFILNSHRAARQLWFAANMHAWHFTYDANTDRWLDDRTHADLLTILATQIGSKLGRTLTF
jgi:CyaY protein